MGPFGSRELVQIRFALIGPFLQGELEDVPSGTNKSPRHDSGYHLVHDGPSGEGDRKKLLDYTSNGLWSIIKGHTTDGTTLAVS